MIQDKHWRTIHLYGIMGSSKIYISFPFVRIQNKVYKKYEIKLLILKSIIQQAERVSQ